MKCLSCLLAATALVAASAPAQAAVSIDGATTIGTYTVDQGASGAFTIGFSEGGLTNPFNEILAFMSSLPGLLSITATTTTPGPLGGANDTDFTSVSLQQGPFPGGTSTNIPETAFSTDFDEFRRLNAIPIAADTAYRVVFQGTPGTENGSFGASLSFTPAAVPEPSTWAMMLLGFGAIGFAMRRKTGATGERRLNLA